MEKRGCLIAKLADTALISVVKQAIQVIAQQEADRLQLLWADRGERLQLAPNLSAPLTIDRDALTIALPRRGCAAARCAIPVGMTSGASCLSRIWCPCHRAGMTRGIKCLDPITREKIELVLRSANLTRSPSARDQPQATKSQLHRELTWQPPWWRGHKRRARLHIDLRKFRLASLEQACR